jgi:CRP/FNR family transcriptional regulator, cyclic AMP receptor protein
MNELEYDRIATTIYEAPLGQYIGRNGAEVLARFATEELQLADKEPLFRKGEYAEAFFIVTSGRLALMREKGKNRPEVIIHVLEPGDMVGELSAIDGTQHTVTCCALGDATVLEFKVDSISSLLEEHPRVVYDFMRAVIMRVHQTTASISRQQQELADYIATGGRRQ